MKKLSGISASPGIAIGKAFLHLEKDIPEIPRYSIRKNRIEGELNRLKAAFEEAAAEIKRLNMRLKTATERVKNINIEPFSETLKTIELEYKRLTTNRHEQARTKTHRRNYEMTR